MTHNQRSKLKKRYKVYRFKNSRRIFKLWRANFKGEKKKVFLYFIFVIRQWL